MVDDAQGGPSLSFTRELPMTRAAVSFANERHAGQRRKADGASFLAHPLEAASLLERSGYPDHVIAAAVLHDVLEDTDAERRDLSAHFGSEVCELVSCLSDDETISDEEARKDDVRGRVRAAAVHAQVIYAADKVSKVRELRALLAGGLPEAEAARKLDRYRKSLVMLEDAMPDQRLVELLRYELEALTEMPPDPDEARRPEA